MPNRRDWQSGGDSLTQAMAIAKKYGTVPVGGGTPKQWPGAFGGGGGGGPGWMGAMGDYRDAVAKTMSTYAGGSAPPGFGKKVGPGLAATEADAAYLAHQERLKAMEEADRRRRQQSMYDAYQGMGSAGYGGGGGGGGWPGWQGKWWQRFFE